MFGHLQVYQPIGRLVWIAGTRKNGKDNHGWYLFGQARSKAIEPIRGFLGRQKIRNLYPPGNQSPRNLYPPGNQIRLFIEKIWFPGGGAI